MPATLVQLLKYGGVSAIALGVDLSVLRMLVNYLGCHYLIAASVAFVAGATVAYTLSVRFVFTIRKVAHRSIEFGYFVALGVAGLFVNAATMFVAVRGVDLGLVNAKLLAAGCTFATNFTLRRRLLFSQPQAQ